MKSRNTGKKTENVSNSIGLKQNGVNEWPETQNCEELSQKIPCQKVS